MKKFFKLILLSSCLINLQVMAAPTSEEIKINYDMQAAAEKALKEAETVLERTLYILEKNTTIQEYSLLEKAQPHWLKTRDIDCKFDVYPYEAQTIYPVALLNCKIESTEKRINWLSDQLYERQHPTP